MFKLEQSYLIFYGFITLLLGWMAPSRADITHQNTQYYHSYRSLSSHQNIWEDIRRHFALPIDRNNPLIRQQIKWIKRNPYAIQKMAQAAEPYLFYVFNEVKKRKMPAELALLPMLESGYDPYALSQMGAAGLWQIMPGTGTGFGLKQNWWFDGRRDIAASTRAALNYLSYLHGFLNEDWLLAIAAYDSGEGTVKNALRRNQRHLIATDVWALRLPSETRAYVPRLLAIVDVIKYPQDYQIELPFIANQPYFTEIKVERQLALKKAAKLAGISLVELYKLNPGYNHWATPPKGPHKIVIPVSHTEEFEQNYVLLKDEKPVTWDRHTVTSGETLSKIARRYHTSVKALKVANHLTSDNIQIKQALIIPSHQTVKREADDKRILPSRYNTLHHKPVGPKQVRHTVKKGESYSSLSRKYHVKPAAIQFWNQLNYNKHLHPGQELVIWVPNKNRRHRPIRPIHYTVKAGDNLTLIAKRFHVKVSSLKKWNPQLTQEKYLHTGKVVHIRPKRTI